MKKEELITRLTNSANIDESRAKQILEQHKWDIFEAFIFLEESGEIQKPNIDIFYSNKTYVKEELNLEKVYNNEFSKEKKNKQATFFEKFCKIVDILNNIFIEIKASGSKSVKFPATVFCVILFLVAPIAVPIIFIMMIFGIEFSMESKFTDVSLINSILKKAYYYIDLVKEKIKRELK